MTQIEFDLLVAQQSKRLDEAINANLEDIDEIRNKKAELTDEFYAAIRELDIQIREIEADNRDRKMAFKEWKIELMKERSETEAAMEGGLQ